MSEVYTGWLISSDTSLIMYKMIKTQTILAIMIFRDCNSNILNDLIDLSSLRPGTVFCMGLVSFMGGNVSWHAAKIENQGRYFCKKCLYNRCPMTI